VEAAAREARVSVRGGCFCNPGAAESCGLGHLSPVPGAVRASLGVASAECDVRRLVDVIASVACAEVPDATSGCAIGPSVLRRTG
jgi:selenocysteine lyase/cysteine desulfurase